MKSLLTTAFTGKDNATIDISIVVYFMASLAFICFMGFSLWRGEHFQGIEWSASLGGLAAAHAGSQRLKAPTEPGG